MDVCVRVCGGASLLNRRRQQQITKHKILLTAKCLMALAIYGQQTERGTYTCMYTHPCTDVHR